MQKALTRARGARRAEPANDKPGDRTGEPAVRCAIYTRRSAGDAGAERSSSLSVQREAAEAFIMSRRHEGWVARPERYDDDGISGASMDRPALQRLLADAQDGEIDCIVVYKVDRLSRSLLRFARLTEFLQRLGVAVVSVTQPFNTATSAGRLTLNALLSFAQFERELFSQRIRDTIGAARRQGKWFAGPPMYGYCLEPKHRRLVVEEQEAQVVREIFQLYLGYKSVARVVDELARRGRRTRERTAKSGRKIGGIPFSVGAVCAILDNVTCAGKVRWEGKTYPGEHEAIVPEDMFNAAARIRAQSRRSPTRGGRARPVLSGKLYCRSCNAPMKRVRKGADGHRYWYYVCTSALEKGWESCPAKGVSAPAAERAILEALRALATDRNRQLDILRANHGAPPPAATSQRLGYALSPLGAGWGLLSKTERNRILRALLERVVYDASSSTFRITIRCGITAPPDPAGKLYLEVGVEPKDMEGRCPPRTWTTRQRMSIADWLALGHHVEGLVRRGLATSYVAVGRQLGLSRTRVNELASLAFLAPAIQEEILTAPQDELRDVSLCQLGAISVEPDWGRQRELWKALRGRETVRPSGEHGLRVHADLHRELQRLHRMSPAQLRRKYQSLFGEESRSRRRDFLLKRIAWRLQALALGGLSEAARQAAKDRGSIALDRLRETRRPIA